MITRRGFGRGGLAAATITAVRTDWLRAAGIGEPKPPFEMPIFKEPKFAARVFDIRKFGANAGGQSACTQAIAAAIEACAKAGGGRVLVPSGVWLTGPVHLRSNVELHVADGAELRFSQKFEDYLPPVYSQRGGVRYYGFSPLIYAHRCDNIAVTGKGALNGQGDVWWPWTKRQPGMRELFNDGAIGKPVEERVYASEAHGVRPPFVLPIECTNVLLEGFTINNGPSWNIHPVCCENLTVRGVSVVTQGPNNDGIDPDSCRNVVIEDCLLDTGDDCICLKAGRDQDGWAVGKPCENLIIRRCKTRRGHGGVVFGSEMSAGIRNVFVHDCEFDGTDIGLRFKSLPGRGGYVENIWCQDIKMDNIRNAAIHMTFRYSKPKSGAVEMPVFKNYRIRNVMCAKTRSAVVIQGIPENYIQDVHLDDLTINADKSGVVVENARKIKMSKMSIQIKGTRPLFSLSDVQDVEISDSACPADTKTFIEVKGTETRDVRLVGLDLSKAGHAVELGEDVPKDAVQQL
ncbi:MAG: glycoside hydrolase family 28 protein [Kiritimatiellae bacterium]|nr:glycoside hydrolase family 28 protein [Kiritimatiellia bacterium]